jgi:unsaturated chondroitin disaccharide hydrolase
LWKIDFLMKTDVEKNTCQQNDPEHKALADMGDKYRAVFDLCVRKTRRNITALADEQPPKTWSFDTDGIYSRWDEGFFEIGNWTSSFFTGMALIAWRETEDEYFLQQVRRLAPLYREKAFTRFMDAHHDIGFLYSLYSVALYKLTGDKADREVGLRAAEALSQRFIPAGNYIRAWGRMDEHNTEYDGLAIIDCLMNLPLLYWASNEAGDNKYRDIAVRHADMVLQNFIRLDGSVYHAYRFDLKTGQPMGGDNYCGRGVESHWARGASWAIYGFALSYGYTQDRRYLDASVKVAEKFIACLDGRAIPVWDFRLPAGEKPLLDTSAAAVVVCGIQELQKHQAATPAMLASKQQMLAALCSNYFLDANETCPGILNEGQVGDGVGKARSVYTSWGDYFLMEALASELFAAELFW